MDMSGTDAVEIASRPQPACYLCGSIGAPLYSGMKDRLFGAPGTWGMRRCSTPSCGLVWLDPQPTPEDIHKAYIEYYTHEEAVVEGRRLGRMMGELLALPFRFPFSPVSLSKKAVGAYLKAYHGYPSRQGDGALAALAGLHPGRKADVDFEVMYLPYTSGGALLDVGCGSGRFLAAMRDRGWKVQGIDTDPEAVEVARRAGLDVRQGELDKAAFPTASFDAVTLSHLIEHVFDPIALLRECRRLLKPGGRLVIVTPNTESWGHRLYGRDWMHLAPPGHIHLFNPRSLRSAVERSGLRVKGERTIVRGADGIFLGCRNLRLYGRHVLGSPQSIPVRFWARTMQLVEALHLRRRPGCGEEIAIEAMY